MRRLTVSEIEQLKKEGITHIATLVKTCYFTEYWHVVSIDRIVKNNRYWIPCPIRQLSSGAVCRVGVRKNTIDWTKTRSLICVYYDRKNGGKVSR